ncbi:MAG: hypothetical protein EKK57_11200 [Proteobacteria bacterium]|nr:MAG: hypothetical protein EKK57_11200 [Pseudomonadota bacterium]
MALPGITSFTEVDGAIGFTTSNIGLHVKLGTSTNGVANQIVSISNLNDAKTTFGSGELVDAIAVSLDINPSPVYAIRMNASVVGSVTDIIVDLQSGSDGALATTGSTPLDTYQVIVQIVRAGKVGVNPYPTFVYSMDNGNTFSPETSVPGGGTFVIPQTGVTLVFSNGATGFKTGDQFTFYTTGATWNNTDLSNALTALLADSRQWEFVHVVGPCSAALAGTVDTFMNTALTNKRFVFSIVEARDLNLLAKLVTAGNVFPMMFAGGEQLIIDISYDAGNTYTEQHSFTFPMGNIANIAALVAALKVTTFTGGVFSVGNTGNELVLSIPSNAGKTVMKVNAGSTAVAAGLIRYTLGQLSDGETEAAWETSLINDFVNFSSIRVNVCAGAAAIFSQATSRYNRRNIGSLVAARTALIPISEDLGNVQRGSLPDILLRLPDGQPGVFHDEYTSPSLDAARFTTIRTIPGIQGYYITNGRMFAPNGSDFTYQQYRRVMNRAETLLNAAATRFINTTVRTNSVGGTIYEVDARKIEKNIYAYMFGNMRQDVSNINVVVDRNNNVYSTLQINITANIQPFGYAKFITLTIGFAPVAVLGV